MIRTVILAINDDGASSARTIETVATIRRLLDKGPFVEVDYQIVNDEQSVIRARLRLLTDSNKHDLILTTGGTGLQMKERTPEATKEVIEREVPGLMEYVRIVGMKNSPRSILFRGVCGVRKQTMIVNLPGGPRGASDALRCILPSLPPAMDYILGNIGSISGEWQE